MRYSLQYFTCSTALLRAAQESPVSQCVFRCHGQNASISANSFKQLTVLPIQLTEPLSLAPLRLTFRCRPRQNTFFSASPRHQHLVSTFTTYVTLIIFAPFSSPLSRTAVFVRSPVASCVIIHYSLSLKSPFLNFNLSRILPRGTS